MSRTRKVLWTVGNLLMLGGLYLLLFVGGLMADEQYNVYAASGKTDIELPTAVVQAPADATVAAAPVPQVTGSVPQAAAPVPQAARPVPLAEEPSSASITGPSRFDNIPALNGGGSELTNVASSALSNYGPSTITRLVIPAIKLDKKVVEVAYTLQQAENGQNVQVWNVDKYRVGHHVNTSNPGGGGNIVLAGHSGGYQYPFNDIYYLKPGDSVELNSNGQLYDYTVTETHVVDQDGQPWEKQLENARFIEPTNEEVVTMVTCWPLTNTKVDGRLIKKFTQRVIVRAKPANPAASVAQPNAEAQDSSGWVAR
jgi:LPXTG-site transpeptidase (sortase) family protein